MTHKSHIKFISFNATMLNGSLCGRRRRRRRNCTYRPESIRVKQKLLRAASGTDYSVNSGSTWKKRLILSLEDIAHLLRTLNNGSTREKSDEFYFQRRLDKDV